MKLVLVLTTEAVGPTVAEEVVVAMVEVVDPGEEDSEDIKLSGRRLYSEVALVFT